MYVWQMNDGRWHISLETNIHLRSNGRVTFGKLLANKAAFKLFDRGYETEAGARAAYAEINALMGW